MLLFQLNLEAAAGGGGTILPPVLLWKGAVQPNDLGEASGNEAILWKGAVQPARDYNAPVVETPRRGGGRRRRRYVVEIDGEFIGASNQAEVEQILESARRVAEESVETAQAEIALPKIRIRRTGKKAPVPAKLRQKASTAQAEIRSIIRKANERVRRDAEIAEYMSRQIQKELDDDDDAIIALFLS